jgi:mono/diheme cytochrome c family protein
LRQHRFVGRFMIERRVGGGSAMLLAAFMCVCSAGASPVRSAEVASADPAAQIARGKTLFISYGCGWCHEDGGRKAGRCPQLMGSERDDNFILSRVAAGSPGKMPAFGEALSAEDMQALLVYIRSLKPEGSP